MSNLKNDDNFRVTIRMKKDVVDWYRMKADSYSMAYTSYMSLLLTNIYEKEQDKEFMKSLNATMGNMVKISDSTGSPDEMIKSIQKMLELTKAKHTDE